MVYSAIFKQFPKFFFFTKAGKQSCLIFAKIKLLKFFSADSVMLCMRHDAKFECLLESLYTQQIPGYKMLKLNGLRNLTLQNRNQCICEELSNKNHHKLFFLFMLPAVLLNIQMYSSKEIMEFLFTVDLSIFSFFFFNKRF